MSRLLAPAVLLLYLFQPLTGMALEPIALDFSQEKAIDVLGAVKKTMELQPNIFIQQEQLNAARGAYRAGGGNFDWQLETALVHQQDNAPVSDFDTGLERRETSDFSVGFSKLLRSGIVLSPYVQYTGYRYAHTGGGVSSLHNTGGLGLLIKLPLLRGLGYENVGSEEIATGHEVKANQLLLARETANSVYASVKAFWSYLASVERLKIMTDAENRARSILKNTQTLARAGEVPAAELVNVQANLADKKSSRLTAAQAVTAAKAGLGIAMGLPYDKITVIPPPVGPFPSMDRDSMEQAKGTDSSLYLRVAADRRYDLRAAGEQNEAARIRMEAAKDNRKPQLDLELSMGYHGLESGSSLSKSFQAVEYDQDTPDWNVGTRLTYPLGNNTAEGAFITSQAAYRRGVLQEKELLRSMNSDINVILSELFNLYEELRHSEQAVQEYMTAVSNEQEKYMMGETTLLDLLYIEDRRDNALLNHISVRERAAVGLANLRYVTGHLVRFIDEQGLVTMRDLTTMLLPNSFTLP